MPTMQEYYDFARIAYNLAAGIELDSDRGDTHPVWVDAYCQHGQSS